MKARLKKGVKKGGSKVNIQKLSNKRIGRLAKQGKLKTKRKSEQGRTLQVLKDRVNPEPDKQLQEKNKKKEERDIPLQEADYEYFATPGRDFSFLSDRSFTEDKSRKRKQSASHDDYNITSKYEKTPRRMAGAEKEAKALLPIKSKEKGVIARVQEEESEGDEDVDPSEDGVKAEPVPEPLPTLSTVELFRQRQEKLAEKKQTMALLASALLEEPEDGIGKLKQLRGFLEETEPDIFLTVRKLAMVSLLEVFKDIIPSYRVRVATEEEKTQAAKKETKKLRDFEELLISNYRHYLEYLETVIKGQGAKGMKGKKRFRGSGDNKLIVPQEASRGMQELGIRCLCELLVTHPHFNYRTNIITIVVPFATINDPRISELVCSYIKQIFKEDKSGELTLEVVRLIGRIIKAKHFNVKPRILKTFLALKIKEVSKGEKVDNKAARREKFRKLSRKDKKRHKQMRHLEKELDEVTYASDREKRLRLNTEIVNMIFLTYFRILKTAKHSVLLSTVLEGLAKFAHVINIDFFDDLFMVVNELVDSGDLTYRESLHCVQTAFTILSGQGAALNIDPIRFYAHLYRTIFQLHAGVTSEDVPIALKCLDLMINRRRKQVSQQRVLAYLKRMTTLALQLSAHGALGSLSTVRSMLHAFPKSDLLLDTDSQGSGFFLPELDEPEHCNAHNTALYELHLLRSSYHPEVQRYASHLLQGAPSQGQGALPAELSRRNALELFADFDPSQMTFNPSVENKPKKNKKKLMSQADYLQKDLEEKIKDVTEDASKTDIASVDFYDVFSASSASSDHSDSDDSQENKNNTNSRKKKTETKSKR